MRIITIYLLTLLIVVYLSMSGLRAQSSSWEDIFENYSRTRALPGTCLWEFGMTDTTLLKYHGDEHSPMIEFAEWTDIYQHWSASVFEPVFRPVNYDTINKKLYRYFTKGLIVMPALLVKGSRFKRALLQDGTIYIDQQSGKLEIKTGESVTIDSKVFASAPFVQRVFQPDLQLFFSDSFFYTNANLTVKEVQLQLNGDLFRPVKLNQITKIPLSFGENLLVVKYVLSNNEVYYSQSSVYFNADEASFGNADIRDFKIGDDKRNIYTSPYRQTETGEPLGAYIEVVPGLNNGIPNTCIKKPIIFVEGIDFGYENHATGCYGGKCGSMGLRDLLRGRIFHPYEQKSKDAYEDWRPIEKAPQLINELRNNGYDLIYLDFHNGADFMENNAMLLVELIKRVNFIKCSKEEIVVIGASMGGQISRFALAYMEQLNIPHCVRNFVAFDSPNQGANIPLGLQHFLYYYKGKLPKIKDQFDRKINRAASRELLQLHCLSMDGGGEHGDRVSFTSALGQLGSYPSLCRKIALLNGSINQVDLGHEAGEELLKMNPYLGKLNFDILEVSATVWSTYAKIEGKNIVMEAQYPFHNKHVVEVPGEALQNDFIPGSLRYDVAEYKVITGVFNILNRKDATCFIPTYSSLDLYNKDPKFDIAGKLNPNIKNPLYTPFDAFFGVNGQGQEHMMITDENIHWLIMQLEENRDDKPLVLRTNYNMGRQACDRIGHIEIRGKNTLSINGKGRNGFGNGRFDQANQPGSHYVAKASYCQPVISVGDSAQLVLGASATDGGNTAELHILRGATLSLKSGSTLVVNDGSVLVIDEGANMHFEKGAKIFLDGDDARLFVDGHLIVGDGAVFTVFPGSTKRLGFLKFRHVGGGYGAAQITAIGNNAAFVLKGKSREYDMVLQIEGEVEFSQQNPFKSFKVSDARIAYGNKSALLINGNAEFVNVVFDVLSWARQSSSKALFLKQFYNASIKNCAFKYFDVALETFGLNDADLKIEACQISDGNQGLVLNHAYTNIVNTVFRALPIEAMLMLQNCKQAVVSGSHFTLNGNGINILNPTTVPVNLFVDNCSFSSNTNAVKADNTRATFACSRFILNRCALMFNNGLIGMSPKHLETGRSISLYGGNCTIVEASGLGINVNHTLLYLDNGGNNFILEGQSDEAGFIKGNVLYSIETNMPVSPYYLIASGNYWSSAGQLELKDANPVLYSITTDFTNALDQKNSIVGTKLKSRNSLCYTGGNCPECEGNTGGVKTTGMLGANEVIELFPQPANDQVTVVFKDPVHKRVLILRSLDGKIVYQAEVEANEIKIDVSICESGLYVLEVQSETETHWLAVIVKQP